MSSHIQSLSSIDTNVKTNTTPITQSGVSTDKGFELFGSDGLTFFDVIDMVNPLQQIPLVGQLYRRFTGDEFDPGSRVVGGALYFGPIGAAAAVVNVAVDEATGKDIGEHMISMIDDGGTLSPEDKSESSLANNQAQTDDPISNWASEEIAYRNRLAGNPAIIKAVETTNIKAEEQIEVAVVDPVSQWAENEIDSRKIQVTAERQWSVAEFMASQQQNVGPVPTQVAAAYQATKTTVAKISDGRVAPAGGWFSAAMIDAANRSTDLQGQIQKPQPLNGGTP